MSIGAFSPPSAPPSSPTLFIIDLTGFGGGGGGVFLPDDVDPESGRDGADSERESGRSKGALGVPGEKPLPLGVVGAGEEWPERSGEGEEGRDLDPGDPIPVRDSVL